MKIVFLSDDFPPQSFGGAGIVAHDLAKKLYLNGHKIFIITTVQKKSEEVEETIEGLNIFRIYSNYHERWRSWLGLYNPQTINKIKRIIKQINPEIAHVHNIHYYLSYKCLKIVKKYSGAVFLTIHNVMLVNYGKLMPKNGSCFYKISIIDKIKEARKRYNPSRDLFIRHYLKYVDKIFSVSNALKKVLEINGIKNIETIYNGIDINDWKTEQCQIERFKKENNLIGKKIIFFSGRISRAKGGEIILKAMKLVTKEVKNVILLVAGEKKQQIQEMINLSEKIKITNYVKFVGWLDRENIKLVYHSCDICVVPSICFDSFPNTNLEAMASGKPVVGTCFGGTPEIVIDNQTGYIVNPLNVKELSEKIIDLLKNPQKARQFGEAGHKRVRERFSLQEQTNKIFENYKRYI